MRAVEQGGRERSFAEYSELLLAAGWTAGKLVETRGPMSVIEALPAPESAMATNDSAKLSSETKGHVTATKALSSPAPASLKTGGDGAGIQIVAAAQ